MPERFDQLRENVGPGWQPILDRAADDLTAIAPNWDAVHIASQDGSLRLYVMTGDAFHTGRTAAFFDRVTQAEFESRVIEEYPA